MIMQLNKCKKFKIKVILTIESHLKYKKRFFLVGFFRVYFGPSVSLSWLRIKSRHYIKIVLTLLFACYLTLSAAFWVHQRILKSRSKLCVVWRKPPCFPSQQSYTAEITMNTEEMIFSLRVFLNKGNKVFFVCPLSTFDLISNVWRINPKWMDAVGQRKKKILEVYHRLRMKQMETRPARTIQHDHITSYVLVKTPVDRSGLV